MRCSLPGLRSLLEDAGRVFQHDLPDAPDTQRARNHRGRAGEAACAASWLAQPGKFKVRSLPHSGRKHAMRSISSIGMNRR